MAAFISDEGTENECSTSEDGTISNCGIGETNEILIPYEITGKNAISKYQATILGNSRIVCSCPF